jgi:hypothetical protein
MAPSRRGIDSRCHRIGAWTRSKCLCHETACSLLGGPPTSGGQPDRALIHASITSPKPFARARRSTTANSAADASASPAGTAATRGSHESSAHSLESGCRSSSHLRYRLYGRIRSWSAKMSSVAGPGAVRTPSLLNGIRTSAYPPGHTGRVADVGSARGNYARRPRIRIPIGRGKGTANRADEGVRGTC